MKITQAKGEGQSQCRRCKELGIWTVEWCCFMYEIEEKEGYYCRECIEEMKGENNE